jgi:hypothetical protein
MIQNWKLHKSPRDILSFIGLTIFYSRWIDIFKLGLGFALCQPDNYVDAFAAMKREDKGGICEFNLTLNTPL